MNKNIAIKAENISKRYRLGEIGTGTLSHDLNRWWANIRGKEDPFLKIGDSNNRSLKENSDYIWSLKDINFEIEEGVAIGIIGRNGAGKSTLLKLLSKVTQPTTGLIKVKGRIASLLEIGTGFHPEMTGRENIFLNGAILGMRHHEIKRKFDEIVDFAGVERYIDTPVKRYSSGMYVRLAFAVAAHLENEILIIDEVLAVGDIEFQKKCLGKMGDVSKGEGRTVLFVSHNMASIKQLCEKGIFLENGRIIISSSITNVIEKYNKTEHSKLTEITFNSSTQRKGSGQIVFQHARIFNQYENNLNEFSVGDTINIQFKLKNNDNFIKKYEVAIQIKNQQDLPIFHIMARDSNYTLHNNKSESEYLIKIEDIRLFPGNYYISFIGTDSSGYQIYDFIENIISFKIIDGGNYTIRPLPLSQGLFFLNPVWKQLS